MKNLFKALITVAGMLLAGGAGATASWPNSVSSDSTLFVAVNNCGTLLSASISAATTTITVGDTTCFPSIGYITIDDEAIKYTGKTASSFTGLTRGADGTVAAVHTLGDDVYHSVIAAHHNGLKDEIIAMSAFFLEPGNLVQIDTTTASLRVTGDSVARAGTGSETFRAGGIIDHLIVSSGMAALTAEQTLYTYTLPANTFVSTATKTNQVLKIWAAGTSANATLERVRIYFGSTVCADTGNVGYNGANWQGECTISQIGTGATQQASGLILGGIAAAPAITDTQPTETISGTIVIRVTGESGVATLNAIRVRHAYVEMK